MIDMIEKHLYKGKNKVRHLMAMSDLCLRIPHPVVLLATGSVLFSPTFVSSATIMNDTIGHRHIITQDTLSQPHRQQSVRKEWEEKNHVHFEKNKYMKLNEEAVKLIQFDFTSTPQETAAPKTAPLDKSWMDFQVDLAVPKNMMDTTKVRKPDNYIRMLPYTIWTRFGEDPVFDVLVFGNEKRLEANFQLDLDLEELEYGLYRQVLPEHLLQDSHNPTVVIENLDIIGFLYNNLNKHGRMLKRNRKRAKAWKTYQNYRATKSDSLKFPTFYLAAEKNTAMDSCARASAKSYEFTGGEYRPQTIRLLDPQSDKTFEADYRILQNQQLRSRFGTYSTSKSFEANPDELSHSADSIKDSSKEVSVVDKDNEDVREGKNHKRFRIKKKRKQTDKYKQKAKSYSVKKEDKGLEELPDKMEDLYKYIRAKQVQDSIRRKELFRKDKVSGDVYENEKQQRKLRERQE